MTSTYSDLIQSIYGLAAFALFGFAPGYLISALPLLRPAACSTLERVLWSLVLSLPFAILLCLVLDRFISPAAVSHLFEALGVAAVLLLIVDFAGKTRRSISWSREATLASFAAAGLALYTMLAPLGIVVHHRLYESSVSLDWSVRCQLVNAAIRSSVSPRSPMFAIAGHAPPLHYYYYWYILCAQVCRLTGISARPALAASCAWSGFSLLACIFLTLKYMSPLRNNIRRQCAVALLVVCVLGLDVIALFIGLLLPRTRLYPSLEFWLDDRSPGWLGALLWAPHHVGGFVFCMTAVLILFLLQREIAWTRRIALAALAGLIFAAAVGTSTYIVGFFFLACLMLLGERLLHRDWTSVSAFLVVGLIAVFFSLPFLRQMIPTHQVAGSSLETPSRALVFMPRDKMQAIHFYHYFTRPLADVNKARKATPGEWLARVPTMLLLYVFEFGFFLLTLLFRIRNDLRRRLPQNELWLWLLFASFALPAFTVSTIWLQGVNDLGRHAGLCMRFVLLIWTTPMIVTYLSTPKPRAARGRKDAFVLRAATAAFILGLAGQVCQIVIDRTYLVFVDSYEFGSNVTAYRFPRISRRFYDIRQAMQAATERSGLNEVVQTNPQGRLEVIFQLYATRQMAAVDTGCAVPFGGELADCEPIAKNLVALFGGSGARPQGDYNANFHLPYDPARITPEAFVDVCKQQSIAFLVAAYTDPVWHVKDSWVWKETPVFANPTARVYRCPIEEQASNRSPLVAPGATTSSYLPRINSVAPNRAR